jgi:hypothetical protein
MRASSSRLSNGLTTHSSSREVGRGREPSSSRSAPARVHDQRGSCDQQKVVRGLRNQRSSMFIGAYRARLH